ncbi:MAG TPA: hypothetical protein VFN36_01295 [Solirubrobacteraceae bacterium]|nr:hypothetical protein [Solirubrobacteraceae bacterium]
MITQPDDIAYLDGAVFVNFQNQVGPQGQASSSGNLDSTIVEFSRAGSELAQWDITGHCDGLTADPYTGQLIATVNEDANSSLYLIDPAPGSTPVQYHYSEPLPHNGGTDSVAIYNGAILISASAPGTSGAPAPQPSYPAVYVVTLDSSDHIANVNSLFSDEDPANVANTNAPDFGSTVNLALTDPDSSAVVPGYAGRFAGSFMLDSQGDQEQIYFDGWQHPLALLRLSASVNDTVWPSGPGGTLYASDGSADQVVAITGPLHRGSEIAAVTPCDSNTAPSTCPAPGYPANYLGQVDPYTGQITPLEVAGATVHPGGLLFVPGRGR